MDSVSRLILCLSALFCGAVFAAPQVRYAVQAGDNSGFGRWPNGFVTESAACAAIKDIYPNLTVTGTSVENHYCRFTYSDGVSSYTSGLYTIVDRLIDQPDPLPSCEGGATLGDGSSKWYWKGKGSTTCQQGCLYIADQFAYDKNSGYSVGWGRLNGLGAPCTVGQESVSGTPPENKPPNTCEAGKCPGTVNGVAVCVKCGSGGSVEKKTETTTKDSGDGGQSDQTTTKTEKKTTCEDGKCVTETTTTTTSSSGGTKSETAKEEQSQDSFCSKNPDHALCKEQKSEFSGGCASGFRCEGDAVQCAMAREQHERMCQLLDNETDLSKIGNRIGTGQDDQDTKNRLGNGDSPIDISTGFASARPVGPTSGCPADVSVGQWTIPFSRMCPHLDTLGNALVGLAYLVGALIVFRRGGSD